MHYYHSPLECIYLVFYEQGVSLQENLWGKNCFLFFVRPLRVVFPILHFLTNINYY